MKKAVEALENAYELDPNVATLRQILAIYETTGDTEAATAITARIEEQIVKDNEAKKKRASKLANDAKKKLPIRKVTKTVVKAPSKAVNSAKTAVRNIKRKQI